MSTEAALPRVLDAEPVEDLDAYVAMGGGRGLSKARAGAPDDTIATVVASGLRGRGGAGFPTGRKWETVAAYESPVYSASVVVNGAEGEPGSFKDRMILRTNPYRVIEGALIAADVLGAGKVVVAIKADFAVVRRSPRTRDRGSACRRLGRRHRARARSRVRAATCTVRRPVCSRCSTGGSPSRASRRRGGTASTRSATATESVADLELAEPGGDGSRRRRSSTTSRRWPTSPASSPRAPTGSASSVPRRRRVRWCARSAARRAGTAVAEIAMGRRCARSSSGRWRRGARPRDRRGHQRRVANPFLPATALDTPLTYEAMRGTRASGSARPASSCLDDRDDLAAVAHGIARFLAVESCGQCTPCKRDGLALAGLLDRIRRSEARAVDLDAVADRVSTVADSARWRAAASSRT